MDGVIATRHIRALYYNQCFTEAVSIAVTNRDNEPFDYVSESARWFYRTLRGDLQPYKKLLTCCDFECWFRRIACEYSPPQRYVDHCITTMTYDTRSFGGEEFLQDATLWYSGLQRKVAVGADYAKVKKLSLDRFLDMSEDEAIMWANRNCSVAVGADDYEAQEYLQERLL